MTVAKGTTQGPPTLKDRSVGNNVLAGNWKEMRLDVLTVNYLSKNLYGQLLHEENWSGNTIEAGQIQLGLTTKMWDRPFLVGFQTFLYKSPRDQRSA